MADSNENICIDEDPEPEEPEVASRLPDTAAQAALRKLCNTPGFSESVFSSEVFYALGVLDRDSEIACAEANADREYEAKKEKNFAQFINIANVFVPVFMDFFKRKDGHSRHSLKECDECGGELRKADSTLEAPDGFLICRACSKPFSPMNDPS